MMLSHTLIKSTASESSTHRWATFLAPLHILHN